MERQNLNFTHFDVNQLCYWLQENVKGIEPIPREDRNAYSLHADVILSGDMQCPCGQTFCGQQHNLAAQPGSGLTVRQFIRRAIIGPIGFVANSISQGIIFPYLEEDYQLQCIQVELKECDNPKCAGLSQRKDDEKKSAVRYRGTGCPRCGTSFDPVKTKVVGVAWLVKKGVYVPVSRWGCPPGAGRQKHYYEQILCRTETTVDFPENGEAAERHRVIHGRDKHDCCPWEGCEVNNPRHPQRATTLWIPATHIVREDQPVFSGNPPSHFRDGFAEGVERALDEFDLQARKLLREFDKDPIIAAEYVLKEEGPSVRQLSKRTGLSESEIRNALSGIRSRLQVKIQEALAARGIDEETISNHFHVNHFQMRGDDNDE